MLENNFVTRVVFRNSCLCEVSRQERKPICQDIFSTNSTLAHLKPIFKNVRVKFIIIRIIVIGDDGNDE